MRLLVKAYSLYSLFQPTILVLVVADPALLGTCGLRRGNASPAPRSFPAA